MSRIPAIIPHYDPLQYFFSQLFLSLMKAYRLLTTRPDTQPLRLHMYTVYHRQPFILTLNYDVPYHIYRCGVQYIKLPPPNGLNIEMIKLIFQKLDLLCINSHNVVEYGITFVSVYHSSTTLYQISVQKLMCCTEQ